MNIEEAIHGCKSVLETTDQLLLAKGREITETYRRLGQILSGTEIILSIDKGNMVYEIRSFKDRVFVAAGNNGYSWNMFSVTIKKESYDTFFGAGGKYAYLDTTKYDNYPLVPQTRIIKKHSTSQFAFEQEWYLPSEQFFEQITKEHISNPVGIKEIFLEMERTPFMILEGIAELRKNALEICSTDLGGAIDKFKANLLEESEIAVHFYNVKPDIFKAYFVSLGREAQVDICKKLLTVSQPNPFLDNWLSENFEEVVRTAGRENFYGK